MNKSILTGWLTCTSLLLGAGVIYAQTPTLVEQIVLPTGSVFEIIVDHQVENPVYNWSFSRGTTFLQAGRNQEFRVRLVEPGTYKLSGKVRDDSDTISYRKEIQITVPNEPPTPPPSGNIEGIITSAVPSLNANKQIVLAPGKDLVRLVPKSDNTDSILLDLNSAFDANGDGDPKNDYVAQNSFFSTKSTPVTIWFTAPVTKRALSLSLADVPNSEQEILILSTEEARKIAAASASAEPTDGVPVQVIMHDAGTVQFAANVKDKPYASSPLLIHWDFGDGQQSMLDAPVHTYAKNGSYNVKVTVRNLNTNEIEEEFTSAVRVQNIVAPPVEPEDGEPEDEEDKGDKEGEGFGATFWTVVKFLVGIGVSIGIGFFIIFVFSLIKKKGGFQGALDKAEGALIPEEEAKEPAPMELETKEAEIVEEPPKAEVVDTSAELSAGEPIPEPEPVEPKPEPAPAAEPEPAPVEEPKAEPEAPAPAPEPAAAEEVPDWLQQGMEKAEETGQTAASPPPAALKEEAPPVEEPTTPPPVEPAMLEPTPEPAAEPAPAPEPAPEPLPDVAPSGAKAGEPVTEAPQPLPDEASAKAGEPAKEDVPDWLQQGMEQAAATGQTAVSPPPPTLKQEPMEETLPPPLPTELGTGQEPTPAEPEPAELGGAPTAESTEPAGEEAEEKDWSQMSPEEKEKARKRSKRQRYRKNKRERMKAEKEAGSDQPETAPEPEAQEIPPASDEDEVKFLIQAEGVDEAPESEEKHE